MLHCIQACNLFGLVADIALAAVGIPVEFRCRSVRLSVHRSLGNERVLWKNG